MRNPLPDLKSVSTCVSCLCVNPQYHCFHDAGLIYPVQSSHLVNLCKWFGLTSDDIDKKVSDEHILEFYTLLEKWKLVAIYLGLTREDITAVERVANSNKERRSYELMNLCMLRGWKKKKGHAPYRALLRGLIRFKCPAATEEVCGK